MIKKKIKNRIKNTLLWEILEFIRTQIENSLLWKTHLFIRRQKPVTRLLGEKYSRSNKFIEIDITYNCNLKCFNCDRSCTQAPSNEQMSVEQIRKFIKESIESNVRWERIRVLGGEPALHPDLIEILNILLDYKKRNSSGTKIQLATNGFGKIVNTVLSNVPEEIEILNTSKESKVQPFYPFNIAPKDSTLWKYSDYSSGCWVTSGCGMGLTRYGYYPCAPAGGIDRVFGFDYGRKRLPSPDDSMRDLLKHFCKYCGHFRNIRRTNKEIISPTWKKAYEKYKITKPNLSLY